MAKTQSKRDALQAFVDWFDSVDAEAATLPQADTLCNAVEAARQLLTVGMPNKAPALDGRGFRAAFDEARRATTAELGTDWSRLRDAYEWADVPARLRSVRMSHSVHTMPQDQRVPVARFWPGGRYPQGLLPVPPAPGGSWTWNPDLAERAQIRWDKLDREERPPLVERVGLPPVRAFSWAVPLELVAELGQGVLVPDVVPEKGDPDQEDVQPSPELLLAAE